MARPPILAQAVLRNDIGPNIRPKAFERVSGNSRTRDPVSATAAFLDREIILTPAFPERRIATVDKPQGMP